MNATQSPPSRVRQTLLAVWRQVGFITAGIVFCICLAGAFDPPRLNWGDSGSDYNVMSVGRNFDKYGFLEMRLTPVLLDKALFTAADSVALYTHYPQLPDLANGVMRAWFGFSDIVHFRLVALAVTFGSLFFIYWLVREFWSRQAAQIALALWVTNPLWLQHVDYLHNGPYGAFFGFGCLFFLVRALRAGGTRANLLPAGLFLFLAYASSYDYWIFVPLLIAAITVAHFHGVRQPGVFRTLAVLAAFAVAAIACKVATNIWGLGGLQPFLHDLRIQAIEHATDDVIRTGYADGVWPTLLGRMERQFSLLLLPLAIAWAAVPLVRGRLGEHLATLRGAAPNPIVLLLAALPFLVAFRELWVAQYYPFLMVVPFYAVGFAAMIVMLLGSDQRSVRIVGIAMFVAVMWSAIDEAARFRKAFLDRDAIRTLRAQLDSLAPPRQRILVNHVFDASYRYYFDRTIFAMVLNEPFRVEPHLNQVLQPGSLFNGPNGVLFVQHKHVTEELFDKGYYNVLANYRLWDAWANPPRYRRFLDSLFADRDSLLVAEIARKGRKVYDSDYYALWRLESRPPTPIAPPAGR